MAATQHIIDTLPCDTTLLQQLQQVSEYDYQREFVEQDYSLIAGLVRDGRADELSESLTVYLGAATKGASAASLKDQSFYAPGRRAKGRVFSFKRSYMDYILHHYVLDEPEAESIVKDPRELERTSLTQYVTKLIGEHAGKSDR